MKNLTRKNGVQKLLILKALVLSTLLVTACGKGGYRAPVEKGPSQRAPAENSAVATKDNRVVANFYYGSVTHPLDTKSPDYFPGCFVNVVRVKGFPYVDIGKQIPISTYNQNPCELGGSSELVSVSGNCYNDTDGWVTIESCRQD